MSFFLPAQEQSTWACDGRHKLAYVFLGVGFLADLCSEAFGVDGQRVEYRDAAFHLDEDGSRLGRMVEHRLRRNEPVFALEVDAWAHLIGMHVLRRYSSVARRAARAHGGLTRGELETAIAYIRANFSSPLRLAEIAASVDMSPYSFTRAFQNSTGTTPHQYITKLRIERAQNLLALGALPLTEIASAVGFFDQSHLTTQFRKALGTTPARYRRAYRS
jgi:AraC family transcriptional regulator